ncbi:RNA-binding domain-containing protein [Nonomuraea sp. NPDC050153]|uniref:RNA-binding domain-containing protein n=1 Tax=Nonomuraea sp. NPDC050153 TaxID=3364359 RepID=UPI0037A19F21
MRDEIARAISEKDVRRALNYLFERGRTPVLRLGRKTETDLWDFKVDCPELGKKNENAWAHIAADVLAFHNNRGGLILFGIEDTSFSYIGATRVLDSKKFNDQIRKYLGDQFWVEYYRDYISDDQRHLGIALIPPRGPVPVRFKAPAPSIDGKKLFERDGSAIREGDSTKKLDPIAADQFVRSVAVPTYDQKYAVDEPFYRILAPEYGSFLDRGKLGEVIEKSIRDPRVAVTSLIGVGGMGKTALATWAALRAYEEGSFSFIVSTTAKDRELSSVGILGLQATLTSYEDLLGQIADILGFSEIRELPIEEREREVRALLEDTPGLLYVDNLETVDDKRLIKFLDDLPLGIRALVTSRRNSVRTASRPIDIPPLRDKEIVDFIKLISKEPNHGYLRALKDFEAKLVGAAWDGIPLAIRWGTARSRSVTELLAQTDVQIGDRQHGEQLLEFSFRRIFDNLSQAERAVLETLSVLERPIPTEAVVAGTGLPDAQILDAIEDLVGDTIVFRVFDVDRNDYCFTTLPITRVFTRRDMAKRTNAARNAQRRLSNWFEATDILGSDERLLVRELRQGRTSDDTALIDLANAAEKRGDLDTAERLYKQALSRNPRSWRAARDAAEFYRHKRSDSLEALRLYRIAGANAPARGVERAKIFREWGILLRDSGDPDATKEAEEKLQVAHAENKQDAIARHALASMYNRRGAYRLVIDLLEPVRHTKNVKTRKASLPLLLKAYEKSNEMLKAAELKRELGD